MTGVGDTIKRSLAVTCPKCGSKANSYLPFEVNAQSAIPKLQDHPEWLWKPFNEGIVIWFFPQIVSDFGGCESGWPGLRRVVVCDSCGLRGLYNFRSVPTWERWGLDPNLRITHCPICGDGPWERARSIDEVAGSFDICCDSEGCWTEYGCDDTPEYRELWRGEATKQLGEERVKERLARSIPQWNTDIADLWKHYTHLAG